MALAAALAGCKSESAPYVAAPQPVRAASVTLSAGTDTRSYTGTIRARYESDLGFRVSGKIVERLVNIGDRVAPGMTFARLDASDYRLSLESAEAELKAKEGEVPPRVEFEKAPRRRPIEEVVNGALGEGAAEAAPGEKKKVELE